MQIELDEAPGFYKRHVSEYRDALVMNSAGGRLSVVKYLLRDFEEVFCAEDTNAILVDAWAAACAANHLEIARRIQHSMDLENCLLSEQFSKQFDMAFCTAAAMNFTDVIEYLKVFDFDQGIYGVSQDDCRPPP